MRALLSMTCLSLVTLLSACGGNNGYYDANGNYIPPANTTHDGQRIRPPAPGGMTNDDRHHTRPAPAYAADNTRVYKTTTTTYTYDRPGYYDYNGYFIAEGSGLNVPKEMFPPNGMCRVWFADRMPEKQPNIESCNGISYRVPAGAYVIYGG